MAGFQVVLASTAAKAREALDGEGVALAVVDLMSRTEAGANGLELARELKQAHPEVRILLTSAYYLSERQLERADCGVSGFIPKPYDVAEVVSFISAKVSGPPSSRQLWSAEPVSGVVEFKSSTSSSTPTPTGTARARR
ncbi:MAG: response regulator [Labilithrix sp.]|nr:response regulator [Labilithrix sp.]